MEKSCTKCGEVKPLEGFAVAKNTKSGRRSACKQCDNASHKKYREENRDKVSARQKKHYEENRDKYLARQNKYNAENRDEKAVYDKKYREENFDKYSARVKKYYEDNRAKYLARQNKYNAENRDEIAARKKKYREDYPEKKAAADAKRRAAQLERIPSWSDKSDLKAIRKIYARCKRINKLTGIPHEVDHVIPMQGENISGLHHSTNLAIIPAALNRSKKNKWEFQEVHYG